MEAKRIRYEDIAPMIFPSSRATRVYAGPRGLPAKQFALGYVVVEPGGTVPLHHHEQEEIYFVLEGQGEIDVEGVKLSLDPLSAVYIPSNQRHEFRNIGKSEMKFLFIYAPAGEVSHWAEELSKA
jgi:quercetin dioxygenase-like cupin family protein